MHSSLDVLHGTLQYRPHFLRYRKLDKAAQIFWLPFDRFEIALPLTSLSENRRAHPLHISLVY